MNKWCQMKSSAKEKSPDLKWKCGQHMKVEEVQTGTVE